MPINPHYEKEENRDCQKESKKSLLLTFCSKNLELIIQLCQDSLLALRIKESGAFDERKRRFRRSKAALSTVENGAIILSF